MQYKQHLLNIKLALGGVSGLDFEGFFRLGSLLACLPGKVQPFKPYGKPCLSEFPHPHQRVNPSPTAALWIEILEAWIQHQVKSWPIELIVDEWQTSEHVYRLLCFDSLES